MQSLEQSDINICTSCKATSHKRHALQLVIMRTIVVAVALLGLLAVACAEEQDKKQQKDPQKYGWDNYGYSEDGYSYEKHYPKASYGKDKYKGDPYKGDGSYPKNTHRKYGGDSPYSKGTDTPYSKEGAYKTHMMGQEADVQEAMPAQQPR